MKNRMYTCWISKRQYGSAVQHLGTETRKRCLVYKDRFGVQTTTEMEVPIFLPIGCDAGHLLMGQDQKKKCQRLQQEVKHLAAKGNSHTRTLREARSLRTMHKQSSTARERLMHVIQKTESTDWNLITIFVRVPQAIALVPAVADEMKDHVSLLPVRVRSTATVEDVKRYIEELSEAAPFDQQLSWDGAVLGEGTDLDGSPISIRSSLEDQHIRDGCVLDLKLHDDCPILLASWNSNLAAGKSNLHAVEYNTISISKEATEDIIEQQEEYETQIEREERMFEAQRSHYKRQKLMQRGALDTVEVMNYKGNVPKLVGMFSRQEWEEKRDSDIV